MARKYLVPTVVNKQGLVEALQLKYLDEREINRWFQIGDPQHALVFIRGDEEPTAWETEPDVKFLGIVDDSDAFPKL